MTAWVRLTWLRGAYQIRPAQPGYAPEPDWSKLPSFDELVKIALGADGIIRDKNHQAFRDVMGMPKRPVSDASDL